jgi:uncharacterized membrane protein YhaH (DUF805 family)
MNQDKLIMFLIVILIIVLSVIAMRAKNRWNPPRKRYFPDNRTGATRRNKRMAHIYSLAVTIISLGVYVVLENTLDFESAMDYWISGLFGVIGLTFIFFTIAAWPKKYL